MRGKERQKQQNGELTIESVPPGSPSSCPIGNIGTSSMLQPVRSHLLRTHHLCWTPGTFPDTTEIPGHELSWTRSSSLYKVAQTPRICVELTLNLTLPLLLKTLGEEKRAPLARERLEHFSFSQQPKKTSK